MSSLFRYQFHSLQNGTEAHDRLQGVALAEHDSVIVAGMGGHSSSFLVAKLDRDGEVLWEWAVSCLHLSQVFSGQRAKCPTYRRTHANVVVELLQAEMFSE